MMGSTGLRARLPAWALGAAILLLGLTAAACDCTTNGHTPTSTASVRATETATAPVSNGVGSPAPPIATDTPDPEINTEDSAVPDGSPIVGSQAAVVLPNADVTPGDVFEVGVENICVAGYSSRVRSVSASTKNAVYAEYGIVTHTTGQYEVDHLIPLELGGSNDIKNLWPEPAEPRPGFHEKDRLENKLHALVCAGTLDLGTAQHAIASDWYAAYVQYVVGGQPPPPPSDTPTPTSVAPPSSSTTLRFISVQGAAPGGEASVTVQNSAGMSCSIAYVTPAGTTSTAQGLEAKNTDADGLASWTWRIGGGTNPGVGTVTVTCGGESASATITIG